MEDTLYHELSEELLFRIIPFWQSMQDNVNGGFYGQLDSSLCLNKEAAKGCILNSRILWFFSKAALELRDSKLHKNADHAYQFLRENMLDQEYGGVFWSVTYDGKPLETMKHTYNQAFAIYALSAYYELTKNEEAIALAEKLYHLIESKCKDEYGYLEAFDREFRPVENEKLSENGIMADKTMNTLLHVMEAYTELYRMTQCIEVKESLIHIFRIISDRVYNPKKHRQEVFFSINMKSLIDLHSYGHDIEAAWLIDKAVDVINEKEYIERMRVVTGALEKEVYEKAYNGSCLYNECEKGKVDRTRIWWVQAETMVGFYNAYQKAPDQIQYMEAVRNVWNYVKDYFIDKREGSEWFWELNELDAPNLSKNVVDMWKCPYHNGRMCIELMRRIKHDS